MKALTKKNTRDLHSLCLDVLAIPRLPAFSANEREKTHLTYLMKIKYHIILKFFLYANAFP